MAKQKIRSEAEVHRIDNATHQTRSLRQFANGIIQGMNAEQIKKLFGVKILLPEDFNNDLGKASREILRDRERVLYSSEFEI